MEEYVCKYLISPVQSARAVYHATDLAEAMAAHNSALPEYADKVLSWIGPTGIHFQFHDSKLRVQ